MERKSERLVKKFSLLVMNPDLKRKQEIGVFCYENLHKNH